MYSDLYFFVIENSYVHARVCKDAQHLISNISQTNVARFLCPHAEKYDILLDKISNLWHRWTESL